MVSTFGAPCPVPRMVICAQRHPVSHRAAAAVSSLACVCTAVVARMTSCDIRQIDGIMKHRWKTQGTGATGSVVKRRVGLHGLHAIFEPPIVRTARRTARRDSNIVVED